MRRHDRSFPISPRDLFFLLLLDPLKHVIHQAELLGLAGAIQCTEELEGAVWRDVCALLPLLTAGQRSINICRYVIIFARRWMRSAIGKGCTAGGL